jgi:hypothetical protein
MIKLDVLKDAEFEEITEARVDSKHRVTLGRTIPGQVRSFRVYRNAHGQVILDPMVSIPAHETWLFKNKRASALVQEGLEDARRGRIVRAKEDFSRYAKGKD